MRYFAVLTLLFLVSNPSQAQRAELPSAERFYQRAVAFAERGHTVLAIADFSRAIELDPQHVKAYLNRGLARFIEGDHLGATSDFARVMSLDPGNAEAYNSRGEARSSKNSFDGAIADFTKAIDLNSAYANAYYNRGAAELRRGNIEKGIIDLSRAIEINPKYLNAYLSRAQARKQLSDEPGARADVEMANYLSSQISLELNPRTSLPGTSPPPQSIVASPKGNLPGRSARSYFH